MAWEQAVIIAAKKAKQKFDKADAEEKFIMLCIAALPIVLVMAILSLLIIFIVAIVVVVAVALGLI